MPSPLPFRHILGKHLGEMDGEKPAANACQNDHQTAASKERTRPFAGAVAHRAVYGSNRWGHGGGRKVGGKEGKPAPPSRLSKMSASSPAADNPQQGSFQCLTEKY